MHTTIVVADDHPILRAGIRRVLEAREDLEVVAEASDGQEAMEIVRETRPDIALLDVEMPRLSGVEVARQIAKQQPRTRSLILSVHESGTCVERALRAGAAGYVVKTAGLGELIQAIDAVRKGGSYLSPALTGCLVNALSGLDLAPSCRIRTLTGRERQVLRLIADGLSSREIAKELDLSLKTIDAHRGHLMQKLDIHKVAGLVRLAVREGLVKA